LAKCAQRAKCPTSKESICKSTSQKKQRKKRKKGERRRKRKGDLLAARSPVGQLAIRDFGGGEVQEKERIGKGRAGGKGVRTGGGVKAKKLPFS